MEMLRHIAALHAHPLDVADARRAARARRRAAGRRTGGSPAASSSGSAWRWRSSAGPSWSSSTSRPRAWTRRPGARPGSCSRSCARDGVTVVLTTHYMDEAERLADQVHIIDHGRLIASGTPVRADPRRRHAARSGWWSPSRSRRSAPASLQAALGAGTEVHPVNDAQPADHRARRRHARWPGVAPGASEHDVLPESLTPRPAHPRGRLPRAHRPGAGPVSVDRPAGHLHPAPGAAPLPRHGARAGRAWRRG